MKRAGPPAPWASARLWISHGWSLALTVLLVTLSGGRLAGDTSSPAHAAPAISAEPHALALLAATLWSAEPATTPSSGSAPTPVWSSPSRAPLPYDRARIARLGPAPRIAPFPAPALTGTVELRL